MCGIGGILRIWPADERELALATPHALSIPEAWLTTIDESIKHRGPDGQGRFRDRSIRADGSVVDVALVHRRLSIIDPACGHQPMLSLSRGMGVVRDNRLVLGEGIGLYGADRSHAANPDLLPAHGAPSAAMPADRVCVVFNGCIYNHRELRSELIRAGHVFTTDHSDTEVLVHGWREWGTGLADRLDGMYAFAIWDSAAASLCIGRDFAYEKPLYVQYSGTKAVFASTAGAVHNWYRARGSPVLPSSTDWFDTWIVDGASLYPCSIEQNWHPRAMVHDLADSLMYKAQAFNELPERGKGPPLNAHHVDKLLARSVESRLEADVPLGCFLSGGVDSSLLAHYAMQARKEAIRTFTVRMPDPRYDESKYAEQVAAHLGTRHTTLDCAMNPADDLIRLIREMGIPFGDSSLLPTYWVSKATRQEVAVALSGDGGDELFAGYDRHAVVLKHARLARMLGRVPRHWFPDRDPKSTSSKLRRLACAGACGYHWLRAIFLRDDFEQLAPDSMLLDYAPRLLDEPDPAGNDFYEYLGPDVLRKSDSASMSVALEVRAPFLSRELTRTCLEASYVDLMPHGQRKGLLRQVARKYLPSHIVDRPKMGFAIPIGEWFRTDFGGLRTMLLDHLNSTEPFGPPALGIDLNMSYVRQMLDEHLGTGPSGRVIRDHSQRLYMLLVLSIWAKHQRH